VPDACPGFSARSTCFCRATSFCRVVVQCHHDISRLRGRARRERRQMGVAKHRYRRRVEHTHSRALHHFDRRDLAVRGNNDVDFYIATLITI
jgi:hypothetical protein